MSVPQSFTLYQNNDQFIEFGPMVDGTTDTLPNPTYLNNLNGTCTLQDANSVNVPGFVALAFTYVAASNGIYRALVEQSVTLPTGAGYTLIVDFVAPGSEPRADAHWEIPVQVKVRRTA